jgi:hypothetical protein
MFVLGMINFFQAKTSSEGSLRSIISIIQGIGCGGVLVYFLIVIFESQELTPAFQLWVGLLFMALFVTEVVEATLLFSNSDKYIPKESHIENPQNGERFVSLRKIIGNRGRLLHYINVIVALVVSLGTLCIHLLIVTDFLFI